MKAGKTLRVTLDIALSVMIVFEMLVQYTGEFLHEVVGFAFFATIVAHVALSASWVRKTARNAKTGRLTARRTALAVVGALLAVATIALAVSSVAISGILSSAGFVWPFGTYATWVSVHTFSAYALCALVVVHLAMHWAFLASALKVPYSPSRRRAIATGVNAIAAMGVVALGVTAAGKATNQVAATASSWDDSAAEDDAVVARSETTGSTSSSNTGSSSNSPGNVGPTASGKSGKSHGKNANGISNRSTSGGSAGSPADESTLENESSQNARRTESSGNSSAASTASGICTLCRKQCQLSSPKCDKPYEAGLLN